MYAVSDAGVPADGDADGLGEEDGDGLGDGDAGEDSDALGCEDPGSPEAEPATRWPAGMSAEPVVTRVREPIGGGARAGTGAGCPLRCPATATARVADAGTVCDRPAAVPMRWAGPAA
jgi:hypothetical protein